MNTSSFYLRELLKSQGYSDKATEEISKWYIFSEFGKQFVVENQHRKLQRMDFS